MSFTSLTSRTVSSPYLQQQLLEMKYLSKKTGKVFITHGKNVIAEAVKIDKDLYRLEVSQESYACQASSGSASLRVWHERLGHVNRGYIKDMIKVGSVIGLKVDGGHPVSQEFCEGCVFGKQTRASFVSTTNERK